MSHSGKELVDRKYNGVETLWEAIEQRVRDDPSAEFLGQRDDKQEGKPYVWLSNKEVDVYTKNLSIALHEGGYAIEEPFEQIPGYPRLENPQSTLRFVGIFAKNRKEWALSMIALMRNSVTIVPFFDSLGPQALNFVINQTQLTTMICESATLK